MTGAGTEGCASAPPAGGGLHLDQRLELALHVQHDAEFVVHQPGARQIPGDEVAAAAGLVAGDKIVTVNGKLYKGMQVRDVVALPVPKSDTWRLRFSVANSGYLPGVVAFSARTASLTSP